MVVSKIINGLSIGLIIIGVAVFVYSLCLEPYKDIEEYNELYHELSDKSNRSDMFYTLRETHLTSKYRLEDYSLTVVILGLFLSYLFPKRIFLKRGKYYIAGIGLLSILMTCIWYIGDLFLDMDRGEFPHWADSLHIPLMVVPTIMITLLLFCLIHFLLGIVRLSTNSLGRNILSKGIDVWLIIVLILALTLTVVSIVQGDFLLVLSALVWVYFFKMLLVSRRMLNDSIRA